MHFRFIESSTLSLLMQFPKVRKCVRGVGMGVSLGSGNPLKFSISDTTQSCTGDMIINIDTNDKNFEAQYR